MNQKLYFATWHVFFFQMKLENLYLFLKMLNILKYEKIPEFRNGLTAVAHADVM